MLPITPLPSQCWTGDEFVSVVGPYFPLFKILQARATEIRGDIKASFPLMKRRGRKVLSGLAAYLAIKQEVEKVFAAPIAAAVVRLNERAGFPALLFRHPTGEKPDLAVKWNVVGADLIPNVGSRALRKYIDSQALPPLRPDWLSEKDELASVGTWIHAGRLRDVDGNKDACLSFSLVKKRGICWKLTNENIDAIIAVAHTAEDAASPSKRRFTLKDVKPTKELGSE